VKLTWPQALAWRVRQHHLDAPVPRKAMLEVASRLCGLQAQVMSSAELTLWARVDKLAPADVHDALWQDRTLVKSWAMRGTLHLLPAAEYTTWQAALSTYRHYQQPAWLKYFQVSAAELEQLIEAIGEALDGTVASRNELADRVAQITGSKKLGNHVLQSWGSMLKPAAFRGKICFVPSVGQNVRFTRPDSWLKGWHAVEPDAARLDIARRYLSAYAPASAADFARWFAISPADARRLLERLGDEATTVDVDGQKLWMLREDIGVAAKLEPSGSVRLLPAFDQYVLGAPRDRAAFLDLKHKARVYRSQGWISPVLLVDGQMVGVWRHERKGTRLSVAVEPFEPVSQTVKRQTEAEAERLAAFIGGKLEIEWISAS